MLEPRVTTVGPFVVIVPPFHVKRLLFKPPKPRVRLPVVIVKVVQAEANVAEVIVTVQPLIVMAPVSTILPTVTVPPVAVVNVEPPVNVMPAAFILPALTERAADIVTVAAGVYTAPEPLRTRPVRVTGVDVINVPEVMVTLLAVVHESATVKLPLGLASVRALKILPAVVIVTLSAPTKV